MLSINDVIKFKEYLDKKGAKVHFHDSCGGQSFTLEKSDDNIRKAVTDYFSSTGMSVHFYEGSNDFVVKEDKK